MIHIVELREDGYSVSKRIKDDDIQEYGGSIMQGDNAPLAVAIYTMDAFGHYSKMEYFDGTSYA